MATELPEYYYRVRENGAFVFRVDTENRQRRIEMDQIAVVNLKKGEIKPHGDRILSVADKAAIEKWMTERELLTSARDMDDIHRAIDNLNFTTHWANTRATAAQLEEVTNEILLAMHDLRTVLVRKKADSLKNG